MAELVRTQRERLGGGPSGLDDPFALAADEFGGMASVNGDQVPVVGMTLGEIRHRLADRFAIDPTSRTYVDDTLVDDENIVVQPGQRVDFLRHAGEKGLHPIP